MWRVLASHEALPACGVDWAGGERDEEDYVEYGEPEALFLLKPVAASRYEFSSWGASVVMCTLGTQYGNGQGWYA